MRASIALVILAGCSGKASTSSPTTPSRPPGKPDRELLLSLTTADRATAAIDPAIGLVLVDHYQGPGEDVPAPRGEQHFCGAALADFLRTSWSEIAEAIKTGGGNEHLSCSDLACRVGGAGEWDPVYHFYFVGKPGGVWLRAIAIADEVSVPGDKVEAAIAAHKAAIARLVQPCAK